MDLPSQLLPRRSFQKEYLIPTHCVDVELGVTPEMALDPNFWPHLVAKFRLGHEVIVRPTDFSYRLHAEVVGIDPAGHWAVLRKISLTEGKPFAQSASDERGYRIDHDPVQGWRILNGRDLIAKDFATEDEAKAALANLKAAGGKKKAA
jgi:hypothetical protein